MSQTDSELFKSLKEGKFVFTGELEPEKETHLDHVLEQARALKGHVIACNVTDNPQSFGYMCSLAASHLIQRDAGMEAVYQMTTRDRNRLALFSDLLGAATLGIKNILALTGDHTELGDTPNAKPVYDLDSANLVDLIHTMRTKGTDLKGNPINPDKDKNPGERPVFHIGVGANPNSDPLEPEMIKVARKISVGADFVQTQVVYDIDLAKSFLKEAEKWKIPVLVGIFPMKSYGVAKYFDEYIPGVSVPPTLLAEFKKVKKTATNDVEKHKGYDDVNYNYFAPFVKELRQTTKAAGIHIMAVGYERLTPRLVDVIR